MAPSRTLTNSDISPQRDHFRRTMFSRAESVMSEVPSTKKRAIEDGRDEDDSWERDKESPAHQAIVRAPAALPGHPPSFQVSVDRRVECHGASNCTLEALFR
jgi:hypothetical protein